MPFHRPARHLLLAALLVACGPSSSASDGSTPTDSAPTDSGAPPLDWQLAPGHFYPAVMPMTLVYPRPDEETEDYARHHWAHPGVSYRIPAGVVQGGAWPFYYELIESPPGAEVGSQLGDEGGLRVADREYGIVRWTPSAADEGRTFTFLVRVTDQEGATVDARWTVTVDSSRFLFLSPDGSPSNPGTIDAPMRDVADWYLDDLSDATYADRLVYFREGTYAPTGAGGSGYVQLERSKPMTLMAYPGEEAVIDGTRTNWGFGVNADDIFVSGLRFEGTRLQRDDGTLVENARTFGFRGTPHQRVTFFEVTAHDIRPGSVGNDNPAFLWVGNTGAQRNNYFAFVANTFDTAGPRAANGPTAVSLSCTSYIVYERNRAIDWDGTGSFYDKSSDDHVSIRNNDFWQVADQVSGPVHGLGALMTNTYDVTHVPGYFEIAYNRIRMPITDRAVGPFAIDVGLTALEPRERVWVYRNSIQGTVRFSRTFNYTGLFDRNVFLGAAQRDAEMLIGAGDNDWSPDPSQTFFDDAGHLAGGARDRHLGTHGADIH